MSRGDANQGLRGTVRARGARDEGDTRPAPIRFRVYAELRRRGTPVLVEIGTASDAESAFEFAWMLRPGVDPEVRGIRIVETGGRVWSLALGDGRTDDATTGLPRLRAKGDRRTTREVPGRSDLKIRRDGHGRIDWSSFGGRDD